LKSSPDPLRLFSGGRGLFENWSRLAGFRDTQEDQSVFVPDSRPSIGQETVSHIELKGDYLILSGAYGAQTIDFTDINNLKVVSSTRT